MIEHKTDEAHAICSLSRHSSPTLLKQLLCAQMCVLWIKIELAGRILCAMHFYLKTVNWNFDGTQDHPDRKGCRSILLTEQHWITAIHKRSNVSTQRVSLRRAGACHVLRAKSHNHCQCGSPMMTKWEQENPTCALSSTEATESYVLVCCSCEKWI